MSAVPGSLGLHHVGIVVGDLDAAMEQYARLGFTDPERFHMPAQGIEAVTYKTGGGYLELITPTDPEGAIARFLEKRGNTVHHIAFRVPDLQGSLHELASAGIKLIDETPRTGAHGWQIAFLHPESGNGILIELVDDRSSASG